MPSASPELQKWACDRFGSLEPRGPEEHLKSKGYILHRGWEWSHPKIKSIQDMDEVDWLCMLFLIKEWDYGSLKSK